MKTLKLMLPVISLFMIILGCSAAERNISNIIERDIGGDVVHDAITIKKDGSHEECIALRPGMFFTYYFKASGYVNFNIHYHAEDRIHYPVDEKGIRYGTGDIDPGTHDFYTEEQEYYCLMWDNIGYEPVKVSFKCILEQKTPDKRD